MSETTGTDLTAPAREFTVTRRFDASRHTVYRAWTEPEHLEWFLNPEQPRPDDPIEVDLRVGGAWRLRMVIDEETDYLTGGVYLEIVPDERLVFAWGAVGGWPELGDGVIGRAGSVPIATIELADVAGGGTEMTATLALPEHFSDAEARRWLDLGIESGWRQTIDRLTPAPA